MKLSRWIIPLFFIFSLFLLPKINLAYAGQCGAELYNGRLTGCYAVNVGGELIPEIDREAWGNCGFAHQCFLLEMPNSKCGQHLYNNHITFCSVAKFDRESAPFGGCRNGEYCLQGADAGNQPCEWVKNENGDYGVCFGGFKDESELRASRIEFQCSGACHDPYGLGSSPTQSFSLSGAPVADAPDGKYSCIYGQFDAGIKDSVNKYLSAQAFHCGVLGLGEFGLTFGTGSAFNLARSAATEAGWVGWLGFRHLKLSLTRAAVKSVGGEIAKIGISVAGVSVLTDVCINAINQLNLAIQTRVIKQDGSMACLRELHVGANLEGETGGGRQFIYVAPTNICSFVPGDSRDESSLRAQCNTCFKLSGVYTPFGCIQSNPQKFIEDILKIAIGIAGGIAFLMIIYGGFTIMTSVGNPEKLTSGKEIITSAIAGLLLIVFSVVILKIIGVDILQIPGLVK